MVESSGDEAMGGSPRVAPLAGIKVLEIGVAMAGPFCGMTLGDYGADVVKIERIGEGDESRSWLNDPFPGKFSSYFAAANRNKRSLAIDLKHQDGVAILKQLAARADVLIDNFRVGALEKLGLGYEALAAANPRLIYCSISGFGPDGPRAHERANDIFMQAFSGLMSITGEEGRGPVKAGISVADITAGMFGVIGVLLAIEARHKTGRGQRVDTSLLEGQIAMLAQFVTGYFASGRIPVRRGTSSQLGATYQAFQATDDWVVVAAFTERMWQGVCRAIERTEWADDPRFATKEKRSANRETLIPMLAARFAARSVSEWIERLGAEGVPCSSVNSIDKVVIDEQVRAREMIVEVEHAIAGKISMAGLPVKLSSNPGAVRRPPPLLGEHSAQILLEIGIGAEDIEALFRQGVIATPNQVRQ
jgi:crotonobetainyl-CoA:carnitine CoA-transferase CaiB-like acyl-CoA transferase